MDEPQDIQRSPELPPGARIEHISVDGKEGVIVRAANGKFLPGTRPPIPITSANAREYQARRVEMAKERFAAGVVEAAIERKRIPQGAEPFDAWQAVGKHAGGVFFDSKTPRAMSDLGRFNGVGMGMLATERTQPGGETDTVQVSIPADVVIAMLAELDRRRQENG